ncbi:hypothetical protein HY213_03985 [Candidatus Peregrinibacteria bacterium]|nr:hypothetical protein [Candidatus Peregrinibacteria bacterium]
MELIGFIAGSLVAISLLPQVIKSWRTRSTKDIALSWTLINLSGQILWIVYGVEIQSASLVIMSSITFLMAAFILMLKMKNG